MTRIQDLFTDISPTYDKANHWMSLGLDRWWRKCAIRALPWPKNTPLHILDLCAGTLDFSLALLERYPQAQIQAVDFSLGMLQHGAKKLSISQKSSISIVCADGLELPYRDQHFDLVICAYGIRNISDQTKILQEIHRLLKPGGYFEILEFFKPSHLFSKLFYSIFGRFAIPFIGGIISKNKEAYTYLNRSIQDYKNLKDYLNLMRSENIIPTQYHNFAFGISSFILGKKT